MQRQTYKHDQKPLLCQSPEKKKLTEKMDSCSIPVNCAKTEALLFNEKVAQKGNLIRATRKPDTRLLKLIFRS